MAQGRAISVCMKYLHPACRLQMGMPWTRCRVIPCSRPSGCSPERSCPLPLALTVAFEEIRYARAVPSLSFWAVLRPIAYQPTSYLPRRAVTVCVVAWRSVIGQWRITIYAIDGALAHYCVVGIHNLGQPQFSIDWHCDVKLSPPQRHGKFSEASPGDGTWEL